MEDSQYTCYYSWCAREFKSKYNLKRHINTRHLFLRIFKCPICSKQLVSKQNLIEHKFIHSGEKPYGCKVQGCGKRYRQLSQLSVHRKLHLTHPFDEKDGFVKLAPLEFESTDEESSYFENNNINLDLPIVSIERTYKQADAKLPSLRNVFTLHKTC